MVAHSEIEKIREALDTAKREAASTPKLVDYRFHLGVDQAGDESIFVVGILDESTSDADWISERLDPITESVRKNLEKRGVDRWVYVRFAKPSDLKPVE